jgi:predicted nucleotidyltransferase
MKPVVAKFRTFHEADQATLAYYRRLSPNERLETLFQLRDFAHEEDDATSGRLARVTELLNSNAVEYVVVGAIALAHHGFPRYTGDLDILIHNTPENARRLESVLGEFGFAVPSLKASDFTDSYRVIQLGVPPSRIDLFTSITGVSFEEAWAGREEVTLGDVRVKIIGRESLIKNKRATGRPQDLADLKSLGADADTGQ